MTAPRPTLMYETTGRVARITLDRPERGNGITLEMPRELAASVERANLDPAGHVIALTGRGKGFCGGYELAPRAPPPDPQPTRVLHPPPAAPPPPTPRSRH